MWVAVIDPKSYEVEFIDAGHGHWLVTKDGQQPVRPEYSGGLVVGIDPDVTYSTRAHHTGARPADGDFL